MTTDDLARASDQDKELARVIKAWLKDYDDKGDDNLALFLYSRVRGYGDERERQRAAEEDAKIVRRSARRKLMPDDAALARARQVVHEASIPALSSKHMDRITDAIAAALRAYGGERERPLWEVLNYISRCVDEWLRDNPMPLDGGEELADMTHQEFLAIRGKIEATRTRAGCHPDDTTL